MTISRRDFLKGTATSLFLAGFNFPVLASTSTTLAAFFPLIFWPGIAGEFMFFLPVTLLAILSSSLVMALFFIPVIGKIFIGDTYIGGYEALVKYIEDTGFNGTGYSVG